MNHATPANIPMPAFRRGCATLGANGKAKLAAEPLVGMTLALANNHYRNNKVVADTVWPTNRLVPFLAELPVSSYSPLAE